jgi:hypothetical protein
VFQRKLQGIDTVDIDDIDVNKALWIRMLYYIDGHVTALECCNEEIAMLIRFILVIQRKFQGTDVVDIDNIIVQKGPLN